MSGAYYGLDPDRQPYRRGIREPVRAPVHHAARQRAIRWPSERHLIPARCGHCRARLLVSDCPTAGFPTATVTCLICSREVCELVYDGVRPPPVQMLDPEAELLCADCATVPPQPRHRLCGRCQHRRRKAGRACRDCGELPEYLQDGRCTRCHMRSWRARQATEVTG